MINTFYEALKNAQSWFFGDLLQDTFIAGAVNILNAIIIISLFYGLIMFPLRWAVRLLISRLKGLDDDD